MQRWLNKLTAMIKRSSLEQKEAPNSLQDARLVERVQKTISLVNHAMTESFGFHTAISSLIILSQHVQDSDPWTPTTQKCLEALVQMMIPFAPHWAHGALKTLGVHECKWPQLHSFSHSFVNESLHDYTLFLNQQRLGSLPIPSSLLPHQKALESFVLASNLIPPRVTIQKLIVSKKHAHIRLIQQN